MNSLWDFAKELESSIILHSSSPAKSAQEQKVPDPEPMFLMDYLVVSSVSIELMTRSNTNISIVNLVPDLNIKVEEMSIEAGRPLNMSELVNLILARLRREITPWKLVKGNVGNLPFLAIIFTLLSSITNIYSSVAKKDGMGVLRGVNDIIYLGLETALKAGQFSLKTLSDIIKPVGKLLFI